MEGSCFFFVGEGVVFVELEDVNLCTSHRYSIYTDKYASQ